MSAPPTPADGSGHCAPLYAIPESSAASTRNLPGFAKPLCCLPPELLLDAFRFLHPVFCHARGILWNFASKISGACCDGVLGHDGHP
jgi:hypothetical protein